LLLGASVFGCLNLQLLSENTCGNRVVEDANGEDCDGQSNCGSSGANACRFLCGADQGGVCPDGYDCGIDGICRQPRAKFERLFTESTVTALGLQVGDTNADRCAEIVYTTVRETVVTSFPSRTPGICTASEQVFPARPTMPDEEPYPAPVLAELTGNARPELVIPGPGLLGAGLFVFSSDANATLDSLLYPSVRQNEPGVRPLAVNARGETKLLLFLGETITPIDSMDGGVMNDGGMSSSDGGMMMDDGGLPPPDGGTTDDGGTPPPDGGMMMDDGGLPPPDGGLPPPDGGMPLAPDPMDGGVSSEKWPLRVAVLEDPALKPYPLVDVLPGRLSDIVALKAADIDDIPIPGIGCDEVVMARAGDTSLRLYRLCDPSQPPDAGLVFEALPSPDVELTGTTVRSNNAALAVTDFNGDGHADLLISGSDNNIHIAYGLGDGHFNSIPPPFNGTPDQRTSVLMISDPMLAAELQRPDSIFVAGDFDDATPGAELAAVKCPPAAPFESEVCKPIVGGCEAVVIDIDGDGLDDIVASTGQELGLDVLRSKGGMGFYQSSLETECPAHNLAAGDFDDDGVADVAFFDQIVPLSDEPVTALMVAHGKPLTAPDEPRLSGSFESAMGLVAGHFVKQAQAAQLFAVRGLVGNDKGGLALVEGHSQSQMLAPFYVPPASDDKSDSSILSMELLATSGGRFISGSNGSKIGLALVAKDLTKDLVQLWLLASNDDGETVHAEPWKSATSLTCDNCVLASIDTDGDGGDELLLFGDQTIIVYAATAGAFVEQRSFASKYSFSSLDVTRNPKKYAPRPLVSDFDGDGAKDVILRATSGELIALWGRKDGTFDETELAKAPSCDGAPTCAGQAITRLSAGTNTPPRFALIGPGHLALYTLDARKLEPVRNAALPIEPPKPSTDYTAIGAADLDGDGIDDLALMRSSSSIDILRGIPVRE